MSPSTSREDTVIAIIAILVAALEEIASGKVKDPAFAASLALAKVEGRKL